MNKLNNEENFFQKGLRKCRNEPFVPLGALVTVVFLSAGLRAFKKGNAGNAQMLMRGRIGAQAFTIIAMGLGAYFNSTPSEKPKTIEEQLIELEQQNSM